MVNVSSKRHSTIILHAPTQTQTVEFKQYIDRVLSKIQFMVSHPTIVPVNSFEKKMKDLDNLFSECFDMFPKRKLIAHDSYEIKLNCIKMAIDAAKLVLKRNLLEINHLVDQFIPQR
jgi:enamine deaminase RidA (YjgF/YER057c/UK114 family)